MEVPHTGSPPSLQLGLVLPPCLSGDEPRAVARDADDSGLHSLWVTDRTMAGMPWLDALTVAGLTQFFGTVAGMRHEFLRTYRTGDTETMEAAVTYTRQDGTQVTLPGMAICVRHHDQIRESRSYIDIGPLFQ